MPTQREYRRKAIERAGRVVGRTYSIAALAAQTVTVARMASGGLSSNAFEGDWLIRADAATAAGADRERKCAQNGAVLAFTTATGVFGHAGTAYADTTATAETLELHKFPIDMVDNALQVSLQQLRRMDRFEVPTFAGDRYYLGDMTWVRSPGDISRVTYRGSPVLSRNRRFEKWNSYSSTGVLQPDDWTLSGAGATVVRSSVANRMGRYTAALTRAGASTGLSQTVGVLWNGVSTESLRGRTVTAVLVVEASTASQVRMEIDAVAGAVFSSYHTGSGDTEELTATLTIPATADDLAISIYVDVNGTVYIDDFYLLVGDLTDAVRRDSWTETEVKPAYDQGAGPLAAILPAKGIGGQYVFHASRPYPSFEATRVAAGTADGDSSDAPIEEVAAGLLARLFEQLASEGNQRDETLYDKLRDEWTARAEQLRLGHIYVPPGPQGGADLPRPSFVFPTVSRGW